MKNEYFDYEEPRVLPCYLLVEQGYDLSVNPEDLEEEEDPNEF